VDFSYEHEDHSILQILGKQETGVAFREIEDEHFKQAGVAIAAASFGSYKGTDYADLVAAGAVRVLERGAPHLMAESHDTRARQYLEEGSSAWRVLHRAVARYVDTNAAEPEAFPSPGDAVGSVVADVIQQRSAEKVLLAVSSKDFEPALNDAQRELAQWAREDKAVEQTMSLISRGMYHALAPEMSNALQVALKAPLPEDVQVQVDLFSRAVDQISEREKTLDYEISSAEVARPPFSEVSAKALSDVQGFHLYGIPTGDNAINKTFELLDAEYRMTDRVEPNSDFNDPWIIAQARLIHEKMSLVTRSPADLAAIALSDKRIMENAYRDFDFDSEQHIATREGRYHDLDAERRSQIEKDVIFAVHAPALGRVDLEAKYLEMSGVSALERGYRSQDISRLAIDPTHADEVAKAAEELVKRHPMDKHTFALEEVLGDRSQGRRDDRSLIEIAEDVVQRLDDRSMSNTPEWEALSKSVDKALGQNQPEAPARDKMTQAQMQMAAMGQGMGM